MKRVTIRVPATTANLGPGFDSFGLALNLYNTVTLEEQDSGLDITGCHPDYTNRNNLVYVAYKAAMAAMNLPVRGLKIHIDANIPISRGLGSSAALLIAGAMGANALHDFPLTLKQILEITTPLEGHPDNLAPGIFGGLTASMTHEDKPLSVVFPLHPDWKFLALVPDFPLSTAAARAVLPQHLTRVDAVHNIGRGALVLKALELGDEELLSAAMADKVHQPYRKALIEDYEPIEQLVKSNGAAFCLSGAGPTLLCITRNPDLQDILESQLRTFTKATWKVLPLKAEHRGAQVL